MLSTPKNCTLLVARKVRSISTSSLTYTYDPAARKRGLFVVLADNFLMNCGFFMVIRLISIHYVKDLGWTAASIGLILGVRQLLQQGSTPLSGILADSFGPKRLICTGLALRVISFVSMIWANNFLLLLSSAILTGLAGSFFEAPLAATITALTEEKERNRFYSIFGVTSELGTVIGVQFGVLLLALAFEWMAIGASICFLTASLVTLILMPSIQVDRQRTRVTEGIRLALHDGTFIIFTILLMGFWFMWIQLTISLPLVVEAVGGTNASLSIIYAINSGITILLGYPLLRLAESKFSPFMLLISGMFLMTLGFGSIAFAASVPAIIVCIIVISLGTLLAMPSQKSVAAALANQKWLGSYLGVSALSLGIGGALGNYAGGVLYDLGKQIHTPGLSWIVFGLVGLAASSGLWLLSRRVR